MLGCSGDKDLQRSDQCECAPALIRRSGGNVGGGCCLGGSSAKSSAVAAAIVRTASSNARSVLSDVFWTPLILRTY